MKLFFDTETTAADPKKARIVQLAAVLCEDDAVTERATLNVIVQPDFVIPEETVKIHGISNELAQKCGIREDHVIDLFLDLLARAGLVVAHNISYDTTVFELALAREYIGAKVKWPKAYCTMLESVKHCKLPGKYGDYKWPRLTEAYKHFFPGETFAAHSALGDVRACMRVYAALQL